MRLSWPRGKALSLPIELDASQLRIRANGSGTQWFAVDGELELDEGEVLSWRLLMEATANQGRFVQLEGDRVIALSEALRRRIDTLRHLSEAHGGGEGGPLEVPLTVLPALGDLIDPEQGAQIDSEVRDRLERMRTALESTPSLPRGLRAKLRDYQKEGVRWLLRLANAGLGAVLADDMGLGKTVQSLAVLLARRKLGPALVVCPTSVMVNWAREAERFAPGIEVISMLDLPRDAREGVVADLGPGQVLLCSYGLLSRIGEALAAKRFATVVYDEAHNLKNSESKRAQSAFELDADFRLGLTGTPIENHLGELWSVMQACVPGLLGSEDGFRDGLARWVEAGKADAADHLRRLIRPFILRRTKALVLDELPERSESVVEVRPTAGERAWYEAQRRLAEKKIREMNQGKARRGQARIEILAEITRLRRAAVDPRLVHDSAPRGAKLDAVLERIAAIVEAGHQVLVFTQFLDVIRMLEKQLAERQIRAFILQGSTGAQDRADRIEAFQRGEADVFLMSLRAGGIGVNLTAADYVIHVDPWWNPAVEDQATGRAHRMGQTRPVTVYRFVTTDTIEPKILQLHEHKRDLAEDILSGMEKSKRLDLDELQALVAGG